MDLVVDGNKYALVKSGTVPDHVLAEAEAVMRIEYADAIGDHEYRLYCSMIRDITSMEITLAQIHNLVSTLRNVYQPTLAKCLNRVLNTNFKYDVTDMASYDRDLDRAMNRSKSLKINIDLKKIALAKVEEKYKTRDGSAGKPTRQYFCGILITLSNDAGYNLNETMTVWEFCERIKRTNKKIENLNSVKNG